MKRKSKKRKQALKEIAALRGNNNKEWAVVWEWGLRTKRGQKAWRKIRENDLLVTKWMSRI